MNFFTSAVLARMLGVHEFGVFSVFYIILQYLNSIQLALIVSPMMTLAPQITDESERAVFLKGMGGYQYAFSAACCAFTLLLALVEKFHLAPAKLDPGVLLPFALSIFCFQAQDWLRRFWYVAERGRAVFVNDVISYVGQVVVLLVLWRMHATTVTSAYYAVAITSLVAFLVGAKSEDVWGSVHQIKTVAKQTWAFGRSLLVASQFQWVGSQGILIIVAAISGVSAAGGIRAVMALLGPVNVLYQLLDNVIPVRAAREFAKSGRAGLLAYLRRVGLFSIVNSRRPGAADQFGRKADYGDRVWESIPRICAFGVVAGHLRSARAGLQGPAVLSPHDGHCRRSGSVRADRFRSQRRLLHNPCTPIRRHRRHDRASRGSGAERRNPPQSARLQQAKPSRSVKSS